VAEPGVLFIVSSPSGGGKTTLIREVIGRLEQCGIRGHFSVSHTTRTPRPAETDGTDYHFVDRETFENMAQRGQFLEWAEYNGNLYGTARHEVESRLAGGDDVFLDIEVQGANQVKTPGRSGGDPAAAAMGDEGARCGRGVRLCYHQRPSRAGG